ncbi:MAG: anti-sigma regulatory factor [Firmicutes bacterium HGW-Firmicutes-1]|jgi:anti-sigma regulatory factor (Ser/Thr protein kinase)|nr:MAG: anti-sigma regulatory factor [Firmicutes bacterium HGW-Firmicutes-1]
MKLHFEVDGGEFTSAGGASSKLKKTLRQLGILPDVIRKVSIAMYEAEINMVIHANGGVVDIEITPERIFIVLQDHGPGIDDVELAMQVGYSTASREAREMGFGAGMGLPNIKKNSDHLNITSVIGEGTRVEIAVMLG